MGSGESDSVLAVDLLPGEKIDDPEPVKMREPGDAELNARYVREGVRIVTEQARYPLNQIRSMFSDTFQTETGEIEYKYKRDPEYQRRHRWDDARKSRLIESFLMNVPVPPVFLYENDLARYEVMDGRQRLTALMDFYEDTLELTDLQHWPELNGRKYSTLPTSIRNGIDRRYLSSIILLNETGASDQQAAILKKLVFERLNSGGVRLSGQETRNAVYNGPLNDLCMKLSRLTELRAMLRTPDSGVTASVEIDDYDDTDDTKNDNAAGDKTEATKLGLKMFESMEDVEIVLRFFAYRHLRQFPQGLNRIGEFLDEFLMKGNEFNQSTLSSYKDLFTNNIKFWNGVAGADAFKVPASKRHFSKIAYDALMYASSALSDQERDQLLTRTDVVKSAISEMYKSHGELFGGRKTNTADAHRRNDQALKALATALTKI